MTPRRLYILLSGVLVLLGVVLVAVTYGASNFLKTKSTQLSTTEAQAQQLAQQQTGLARAKKEIAEYSDLAKITSAIVPQDKDQAEAVLEINNIANVNNVTLTSVTFPASTLGTAVPSTATGAAPAAAATPAVPAAPSRSLSQLTPVPKIPGVYDLQITIANNQNYPVTFSQLEAFLKGLENNRRTAQVSSINIQPQQSNPNQLVFTLIVNDYIKPAK